MDDEKDDNDGFHQFLLDAVYDKDNVHRGELEYTCEDGKKLNLQIVTFCAIQTERERMVS